MLHRAAEDLRELRLVAVPVCLERLRRQSPAFVHRAEVLGRPWVLVQHIQREGAVERVGDKPLRLRLRVARLFEVFDGARRVAHRLFLLSEGGLLIRGGKHRQRREFLLGQTLSADLHLGGVDVRRRQLLELLFGVKALAVIRVVLFPPFLLKLRVGPVQAGHEVDPGVPEREVIFLDDLRVLPGHIPVDQLLHLPVRLEGSLAAAVAEIPRHFGSRDLILPLLVLRLPLRLQLRDLFLPLRVLGLPARVFGDAGAVGGEEAEQPVVPFGPRRLCRLFGQFPVPGILVIYRGAAFRHQFAVRESSLHLHGALFSVGKGKDLAAEQRLHERTAAHRGIRLLQRKRIVRIVPLYQEDTRYAVAFRRLLAGLLQLDAETLKCPLKANE